MQSSTNYDQALKRMLTRAHDGLLTLILPGAIWRSELSAELPASSRIVDLLWEVQDETERIALHLELQTRGDADIGMRMTDYIVQIYRRYRLPVRSIVLYLRPDPRIVEPPFLIASSKHEVLRCTYGIIKLWEIDPAVVLHTDHYYLWPMAGLMAGVTPESVLAVAEQIVAAPLPRQDKSELTGLLGLLAGLRIPKDAITQALRSKKMIDEIWEESTYKEVVFDLGVEKGIEKGIEKGTVRGQLVAFHQLAQSAVTQRFPDVAPELLARIAALQDVDVLRRIILNIAEVADLAALTSIIDAAQSSKAAE